jgi:hypothetical protein
MQKDTNPHESQKEKEQQDNKQEVKNPFREASPQEHNETSSEEAELEQQRKEALTERD